MASSSSLNNNNGIPLATLLDWYKIRDTFFGNNRVDQDIPLALKMASLCQHPDARWLTKACAGKEVTTKEDAKRVFSAFGQNDARALSFVWLLCDIFDLALLRRSVELGFAFAQALLAFRSEGCEMFKFAQLSAAQGERDGFYVLAVCFHNGYGCEVDLDKTRENFLLASELGHVSSMDWLGGLLVDSDPRRWFWWGGAAVLGGSGNFVSCFSEQVELFNSGCGSAVVMFAIGQALHGHVNVTEKTIFRDEYPESFFGPAKQAIAFYQAQIQATKDAMRAWTHIGIKVNVVKDARKLIAKMIWDSRDEALFK